VFAALVATLFAASLLLLPAFFATNAREPAKAGSGSRPGYYDVRTDKGATGKLREMRSRAAKNAVDIANAREGFVRGESALRAKVPSLKVEYNDDLHTPEVIGAAETNGHASLMVQVHSKRADALRGFAKENPDLIGISSADADALTTTADYTNPSGNLSYARLEQHINGIPVFRGEIKAGFNKRGEMFRVINDLAPGLDGAALSKDFGDPVAAVKAAAANIKYDLHAGDLDLNTALSDDLKTTFGDGDWPTTAEKMYFPTEPGVAVPAWRVLIWEPNDAYYVVVDAETGTMLWRKDISNDQTQSATFWVYAENDNLGQAMDSPAPGNPIAGTIDPGTNFQAALGSRSAVTLIGNEGPLSFNNLGWITDGGNETEGNNVEAGLDRDATNGVDTTNGRAQGTSRTFNFSYTPSNVTGGTEGGDNPLPVGEPTPGVGPTPGGTPNPVTCTAITQPHGMTEAQKGAVANLFYLNNRYHDVLYQVGFNEQAGNFQNNNFGRGGAQNDRVSAEAEDCSGANNANFATPSDGNRGRMQMYLFTNGTAPYRDGSLDANVVWHEHTHGVSNRLIGNGGGLGSTQAGGMGEGWSDLFAFLLGTKSSDQPNGVFTTGGYVTYKCCGLTTFTSNYYYGIRRFPYAIKSVVGANLKPYNPLTFADIDPAQISCNDGAFLSSPLLTIPGVSCGSATAVHNEGELWAVTGIEVWARFVNRLGHDAGTLHTLQLYVDGMKVSPLNPTFLQERDALLAAAQANGTDEDVKDIWAAFAARGMGFSASNPANNSVVEAFDLPNIVQTQAITITDAQGNNNGFAEPGEKITINIPFQNNTGQTATNVSFQLVGGASTNLASFPNGTTAIAQLEYIVPAATQCGTVLPIAININSSFGPTSFNRSIIIGDPVQTLAENFDGVTAPNIPGNWTATTSDGTINWASVTSSSDTAPNSVYAVDPSPCSSPCATAHPATEADLTSPTISISSAAATVLFRHSFNTEAAWDGGVLEISIAGGAFTDIVTAGGSFTSNGYNSVMTAASPAINPPYTPNPLNGRAGWTGNSNGFITTTVLLPSSANGQNIQLRWRFGADDNGTGSGANPGWYVDTIKVFGSYTCSAITPKQRGPYDFDGDGKTDVSIFRPTGASGGAEWWYQKSSTNAVTAFQFGTSTDKPVAADFTGDGKTDIAVWRPSSGQWFVLRSEDFSFFSFPFGTNGDIPAPADFDHDGKADATVFRPSTGTWFIQKTSGGTDIIPFGKSGDQPITGDWDGDGKADIAIFRPSGASPGAAEWWIRRSSAGVLAFQFGVSTDKAIPGDYTGDGKTDCAVYRPGASATWFVLRSEDFSFFSFPFGTTGDVPTPGDYDADGKWDAGVFRPSTRTWFVNRTTAGQMILPFGVSTDTPVPSLNVRP